LDVVKLTEPIHFGKYLAQELLAITNNFNITTTVFTVTQDNASANDVMLDEFEAELYNKRVSMADWPKQPWNFTQKEGDVRCIEHIINLAVQAALTQLKATPSKETESYRIEP
jgi:hypothetical protein